MKNYAEEFRSAIEGRTAPETPLAEDDTVAAVAEDIEETTRDFVLKRLAQELKGLPLEGFVVHLLECMGYHARLNTPKRAKHRHHCPQGPPRHRTTNHQGAGEEQ